MRRLAQCSQVRFEQLMDIRMRFEGLMEATLDMEEQRFSESENTVDYRMEKPIHTYRSMFNNITSHKANIRRRQRRHRNFKSHRSPLLRDKLELEK